jgi:type 1 glutamine amidotransferase
MGPQTQEARVMVEDRDHPVTRGLPAEFRHEEEWYSWDRSARGAGFDVLLSVDESSYEPWIRGFGAEQDIRMTDHPIVWKRCLDRGRAIYSAMGHWGAAYETEYYPQLLENAVEWASGATGSDCGSPAGSQ